MIAKPTTDIDLTPRDIRDLTSADAICSFLTRLGYPTNSRNQETPTAYGLNTETADAIENLELLAEDEDSFLRVLFVQLKSVTAKARNELVKNLGRRNADHLLILTKDFLATEFVLIDKETRTRTAPGRGPSVKVFPRTVTIDRKAVGSPELRVLRRLTWTGKDGLDQYDKLRSVFESTHYSSRHFQNRALFADHYLERRLPDDPAWSESPNAAYDAVKKIMHDARQRWAHKDEQLVRDQLYEPLWKLLGFKSKVNKSAKQDHLEPDYLLSGPNGNAATVAFVYRWDRWLDGADPNDPDTPDENPGACVVSALADEKARWVIVTNGRYWRLYSRDAHSRATNFYEVDLEEALAEADDTDPNTAFRYWWLFFRRQAFEQKAEGDKQLCWLDNIVEGSRAYAKRLGDRLKDRAFLTIFPHLAQGFLAYQRQQQGARRTPSADELQITFEATLTLLYRLLFLLYAEARDLLPVREAAYREAGFQAIKQRIADRAGKVESEVPDKLNAYSDKETDIYDALTRLFAVMDQGDPVLNVPCYNGGLFVTEPDADSDERENRIARFLCDNKVPDRHLALAIDHLSRDQDDKTYELVFIDYKSLEVRHLGSIYEGLLEFKLKVADEDLTTKTEKKREKYILLSKAKPARSRKKRAAPIVRKGEVYLSNDKAERKATGSYYTPDPIVEYIVEHTVGPVLAEKLEAIKPELDKAAKTYRRHVKNAQSNPGLLSADVDARSFAASKTYAEHRAVVDRIFDMKVLDPAMGSGHFLVEAVDFITDRLLDFLNRYPNNPVRFMLDKTRRSILDALGTQGVTVDPDNLTDVNLLKRHVLKRCIYGVDLNPMAVELAKVSLWLDAFTLGAPLSFLDHHLRCGNSLVGATFEDLKKATEGQLFAIDYEPLLRAIRHVLFVNAMADATAAEVHKSADEYAQARKELSGYQIVLDLLVADHFVESKLKPSRLLQEAHDLDLTTRDKLIAPLDKRDARLVQQVEAVSRRPDLRFFHWETEFPEVFFGFADSQQRQIKHKNDLATGSAGFDAVVGNPPYVRLHSLTRVDVAFFKRKFESASKTFDIYVLFLERGLKLLADRAVLGLITPNKFMTAEYGEAFRHMVATRHALRKLVDLDTNQVFEEAAIYACLIFLQHEVEIAQFIHVPPVVEIGATLRSLPSARDLPSASLDAGMWVTADNVGYEILTQLQDLPTLGDVADIFVGLQTSADPVYVLEDVEMLAGGMRRVRRASARHKGTGIVLDELEFDIDSGPYLKPLFKDCDLEPFFIERPRHWVIFPYDLGPGGAAVAPRRAIERTQPGLWKYLREHETLLRTRASGAMDRDDWYAYPYPKNLDQFEASKIIALVLANYPRMCIDSAGSYFTGGGNGPYYGIRPRNAANWSLEALLALMVSPVAEFCVRSASSTFRGGYVSFGKRFIEGIPVPRFTECQGREIANLAARLIGRRNATTTDEWRALVHWLYARYNLKPEHITMIEGATKGCSQTIL